MPYALRGLWYFHTARGEHQRAEESGTQLQTLAEHRNDPLLRLEAHQALGRTAWFRGNLETSRTHLERSLALCESAQPHTMGFSVLTDPGVTCRYAAALVLQALGYPDQASRRSKEALAEAGASPFTQANLLGILNIFHLFRREGATAQTQAEACLALATERSFPLLVAAATIGRGAALAAQGELEDALEPLHQGLAAYETMGERLFQPFVRTLLAEALGRLGRPEDGLAALAKAEAIMEETDEHFYAAEIARLHGELLLHAGAPQMEAETWFHRALEIARSQHAKWWELRTAVSLARLWRKQGKYQDARELLDPVYSGFTEGFDLADVQDAKALLDALA